MKKRLLCLSLIFAMTAMQVLPVSAARKDEVNAQKAATQNKLSAAQSTVNNLEGKKKQLLGQIDSTQQEIVSVIAQIDLLNTDIANKEADIKDTKEDLVKAEENRDEQYASMKKRIQYLYEKGGSDAWAQILLESDSIASMLTKAENTEKMYDYDRTELKKMKEAVQEVKDLEEQLETEKAELETSKNEQEEMKGTLETKVAGLKSTASDYETQINSAKAQAQEYIRLIEQQNAELRKIAAQEAAARKAAEEAAKKAAEEAKKQQQAQQSGGNTGNKPSNNGTNKPSNGGNNTVTPPSGNGSSNSKPSEPSKPSTPSKPAGGGSSSGSGASYNGATGSAIVAYARQFIGNPYVYGGNSLTNGIDCSGFTQQIFGHFGYRLPRTSDAQASSGVGINYSEARAGDLIVYPGHVAILTGDGGIVHASNSAPYPKGGIKYSSNALYKSYIAVRRIAK